MKRLSMAVLALAVCAMACAQQSGFSKLSASLRRIVAKQQAIPENSYKTPKSGNSLSICSFVKASGNADSVFSAVGCRKLANIGDIYIVAVPIRGIETLARAKQVGRIEAGMGMSLHLDSMALNTNTTPIYSGQQLPQAYTGKGVVMGIQDVGFDLTHPSFREQATGTLRIKRFWDQLSADTVGSNMYVGAEYTSPESIIEYGHSRDADMIFHGTHTLGIAAGNGWQSKYRGIAYESDICLVSNAVVDDKYLISDDDLYKYTYATDALGFKYIFDYAQSQGKPCVISFSEGSFPDFAGDDILFGQMLERMTGPGRIIVSSAGNSGYMKNHVKKERGKASAGSFIYVFGNKISLTMKSKDDFSMRFVMHGSKPDTVAISSREVTEAKDSVLSVSATLNGKQHDISIVAFRSCYDSSDIVYDVEISGQINIGVAPALSIEMTGMDADVDLYRRNCDFWASKDYPELAGADNSFGINSPSCLPSVICVGATSYRDRYTNIKGERAGMDWGTGNQRGPYSSIGPTLDLRVKPDVMAPGSNIISSMSSYYMKTHLGAYDILAEKFDFEGREYGWGAESGTSMASPAVGGIIALWLQAKPDLTKEDIIGVFSRTCKHFDDASTYPNNTYGYGLIDAYAGLLDILNLSSIKGLSDYHPSSVKFFLKGKQLCLQFEKALAHDAQIKIYSSTGMLVASHSAESGSTDAAIDVSQLPKGVYAIQVNAKEKGLTGSTLMRF